MILYFKIKEIDATLVSTILSLIGSLMRNVAIVKLICFVSLWTLEKFLALFLGTSFGKFWGFTSMRRSLPSLRPTKGGLKILNAISGLSKGVPFPLPFLVFTSIS